MSLLSFTWHSMVIGNIFNLANPNSESRARLIAACTPSQGAGVFMFFCMSRGSTLAVPHTHTWYPVIIRVTATVVERRDLEAVTDGIRTIK